MFIVRRKEYLSNMCLRTVRQTMFCDGLSKVINPANISPVINPGEY